MFQDEPITLASTVSWQGHSWLVIDVHRAADGEIETVDLRRTVVVDRTRRHLDEAISKRGVPVYAVTPCGKEETG